MVLFDQRPHVQGEGGGIVGRAADKRGFSN